MGDVEASAGGGGSFAGGVSQASKTGRMGAGGGREGVAAGGRYRGASPEAAIRGVVRELELSPMINMDFDGMFNAYDAIRFMSPEEVQAALAELDVMEANQQIKMILQMMLINRWAKEDGQGAVEFAMEQTQPMLKMMAMMGGLMGWARQDPETAYAWYEENRDSLRGGMMGRGQMDGMFFAALAQRDMDGAFGRLGKLDKNSQKQALTAMAGQMAMDPVKREEFLKHLEAHEDKKVRDETIMMMVSTWSWQDPEGAVKFIEGREFEEDQKKSLMDSVARSWANNDPERALAWRLENAGDEEKGEVIADGFGNWIAQDQKGAEAWLAKQPAEVRSDELYASASRRLTWNSEFDQAITYAEKIEDEDARASQMGQLYRQWKSNDEEKAQEWLETLDDPTREAIEARESGSPDATEIHLHESHMQSVPEEAIDPE